MFLEPWIPFEVSLQRNHVYRVLNPENPDVSTPKAQFPTESISLSTTFKNNYIAIDKILTDSHKTGVNGLNDDVNWFCNL